MAYLVSDIIAVLYFTFLAIALLDCIFSTDKLTHIFNEPQYIVIIGMFGISSVFKVISMFVNEQAFKDASTFFMWFLLIIIYIASTGYYLTVGLANFRKYTKELRKQKKPH